MASAHVQHPSATPHLFPTPAPTPANNVPQKLTQESTPQQSTTQESSSPLKPRPRSMLDIGLETAARKPKAGTQSQSNGSNSSQKPRSPTATANLPPAVTETSPTPPPSTPTAESQPLTIRTRPVSTPNMATVAATIPHSVPEHYPDVKPPPSQAKATGSTNGTPSSPSTATPQRPNLLSRMGSMLKRTKSGNTQSLAPSDVSNDISFSNPEKSTPHKTFTFSSRSSGTSRSGSPPSPASPSSTISDTNKANQDDNNLTRHQSHSHSLQDLPARTSIRPGITWGPDTMVEGKLHPPMSPTRKRSASTENVQASATAACARDGYEQATVPLAPSFSKNAQEGAGLKARRLSTCLPNEVFVDYCELDREFASSSKIPFRRGKHVGEGATATVRLMYRKGDPAHCLFAVKEFRRKDKDEPEDEYVKKVKSEFSIAKSLHHPNIVDTVRLCSHHGRWNHVMEYCAFGEMFQYVEKGLFRTAWSLQDRLCFFKQLCRGVEYLHSHGIAHRDIKLENLLLTNEGTLKITDFGVSEVFSGEHPGVRASGGECGKNMGDVRRCAPGLCGSMPYIAPEVLEKKVDYDPRPVDVWSCAIVYLTMSFKGSPWPAAQTKFDLYAKFKAGWDKWLHDHPDGVISDSSFPSCGPLFKMVDVIGGPAIKRLILKMLNPDPDKRITIQSVMKTSTMKGIECCSEESYEDEQGCCFDACKGKFTTSDGKKTKVRIKRKHNHVPPKEHKTPKVFQHRFDMGDGYS